LISTRPAPESALVIWIVFPDVLAAAGSVIEMFETPVVTR
jgi:hypothetical protein